MRQFIIQADDLGVSEGTNMAIFDSHLSGALTSTSVIATLPAFDHAADLIAEAPDLGCGAHLSLNLGRPVAPVSTVELLLDPNGLLRYPFSYHLRRSTQREYLRQVGIEVEAQLTKMIDGGFRLDHADSQQHIHMIPGIRDVIMEKVRKAGIRFLRHSVEPWSGHPGNAPKINFIKSATVALLAARRPTLSCPIGFIGLRHTGQMTVDRVIHYLDNLGPGIWEIALHPGTGEFSDDPTIHQPIADYLRLPERRMEWKDLTSDRLRDHLRATQIETIAFGDARP